MAEEKRNSHSYKTTDAKYLAAKEKCDNAGYPLANVLEHVVDGIADGVNTMIEVNDNDVTLRFNYGKKKKANVKS